MPYLYILHFRDPYYHAKHYAGACIHLLDRLERHTHARGAVLTATLRRLGQGWEIGAVGQLDTNILPLHTAEQRLKRMKHSHRYCEICCAINQTRVIKLPGCTPIDRSYLPCNDPNYSPTSTPATTPPLPLSSPLPPAKGGHA